jgi:uncharacterized membrane protein YfcA
LLGHGDKVAIAESLGIVGAISLVGAIPYARAGRIDWLNVWFFGIPGMAGTYGGAWLATFVSGAVQLVLFALVMLLAAGLMFRSSFRRDARGETDGIAVEPLPAGGMTPGHPPKGSRKHPLWQIVLEGSAVGVLTGLVGVGGGFLIVPALVLLGGLPMRLAVGTSLVVIGLKSLSGFYKYLHVLNELQLAVDWTTIGLFSLIGMIGTLIGESLNQRLDQQWLKRLFAVFLLAMGIFVLIREFPRVLPLLPSAAGVTATAAAWV